MSIKSKIFITFLACVAGMDVSAQVARKLINRASSQNLCLQTSPSGTAADGLCVAGTSPIAVTLGTPITGNINAGRHIINGSLYAGNVTSTSLSGIIGFGTNIRFDPTAALNGRSNTSTGGAGIWLANRTADNVDAFRIMVNQLADSATTDADTIMAADNVGSFTFGSNSVGPSSGTKRVNVAAGASGDGLRITSSSGEFHGLLARGNTLDIVSNSADTGAAGDIRFNVGGETSTKGMISRSGAWQIGAQTHTFLNVDHAVSGRLDIRTPSANGRMDFVTDATSGTTEYIRFNDSNGGITASGNISINATAHTTAYNTSSDRRLKTNFQDFDGSAMVMRMQPKEYERKSQPGVKEYGFIAQELVDVLPQAVLRGDKLVKKDGTPDKEAMWSVDYGKLTGVLAKALQEVIKKNEDLEKRIKALESR